jgi:hypothetical protein
MTLHCLHYDCRGMSANTCLARQHSRNPDYAVCGPKCAQGAEVKAAHPEWQPSTKAPSKPVREIERCIVVGCNRKGEIRFEGLCHFCRSLGAKIYKEPR